MGAGIAHAFLLAGCEVVVVERDEESADAARRRIIGMLAKTVERGSTEVTVDELAVGLHTGSDAAAFSGCELIIEAVPEDRALKTDALAMIQRAAPDAVLASNTSSISIDDLAARLPRPERMLGLHFFNPVPASALVELVVGPATDPGLVERARTWVLMLDKTPIVVRDSPGFASSRLGVALALEAIRMLDSGVASAEDIDRAMELGYRHPMGPLRTTDIVGLDVRLGIAEELHATLGERFAPPALLRRLVAEGKLGRKSGEGFYTWETTT
ncbi:3-hydroxyacyl-CoA dehydrogenase family protein [Microbacterium paludicola]|uniref:3-hydroxyacyl-CoA dehydrogenase family protein n=1 Tax=Microbacterium paludicola TaxID=300019 RepID=UPI0011A18A6B